VIRRGLHATAGQASVNGLPVLGADRRALLRLRQHVVSYLGQDPATSLNPSMRVGRIVTGLLDGPTPGKLAQRLAAVGLPSDVAFARRYPHQLSGGQQQRLALARALATDPALLILDEPTTGLDVIIQELVLTELAAQRQRLGFTTVVISHDLAVIARLAEHTIVMRAGLTVDRGEVIDLFSRPQHEYTATLVAASPDPRRALMGPSRLFSAAAPESRLDVVDLYASHGGPRRGVFAAAGVTLWIHAAECVALVGSSGSGKTTIARCIAGLHRPGSGQVRLHGVPLAADVTRRYPDELSGGERQRVAIARALATRPEVLTCDEITSALDTSVQAGILDLLTGLRDQLGLALLLITHDLGVVARVADRCWCSRRVQCASTAPSTRYSPIPRTTPPAACWPHPDRCAASWRSGRITLSLRRMSSIARHRPTP
jgi:ABC-type glutathione transport system ATPase component